MGSQVNNHSPIPTSVKPHRPISCHKHNDRSTPRSSLFVVDPLPRNNGDYCEPDVSWIDMPKASLIDKEQQQRSMRSSPIEAQKLEVVLGRIAMISSVVLLGIDNITGLSVPEQFQTLIVALNDF